MIDDLFEWLWPQPDPANPEDLSLGEARWIRLYIWRTRFFPHRLYRMESDDGLRLMWVWRSHTIWESRKVVPL